YSSFSRFLPSTCSTLSLHDALPIFALRVGYVVGLELLVRVVVAGRPANLVAAALGDEVHLDAGALLRRIAAALGNVDLLERVEIDRKSTRLNSSHGSISYAVFCLKK